MNDGRDCVEATEMEDEEDTPLLIVHASPSRDHSLQRFDDSDDSDDELEGSGSRTKKCRFVRKNPLLCLLLFASLVVLFIAFALKPLQDSLAKTKHKRSRPSFITEACQIYCHGDLLDAVQSRGLFDDDKTFVDMPLKTDAASVMSAFKDLGQDYTTDALADFVDQHFAAAGSDLLSVTPVDWHRTLPFAKDIKNKTMAHFASSVHNIWPKLSRKSSPAVQENPGRHSLFALPHPFIMPGGRFREQYYWDTYFVLRGLVFCDMFETARNTVENFAHVIHQLGFVPNGMRVYYATRSQPPLLSAMVRLLHNVSKDDALLKELAPALAIERDYWTLPPCPINHTKTLSRLNITLKPHTKCRNASKSITITTPDSDVTFARYFADTDLPRPESYGVDVKLADDRHFVDKRRRQLFRDLATGAETGWDFSSRWLSSSDDLASIRASSIVPVDLNAILVDYDRNLAFIADKLGWTNGSDYRSAAEARAKAMMKTMYNSTTGRWNDLLLPDGQQITDRYSAAAYVPLWANITQDKTVLNQVLASLQASTGLLKVGGVVTTQLKTTQQWDSPAAWAPLQLLLADGLAHMDNTTAKDVRHSIMCRFLNSMALGYNNTGYMFEKYDAFQPGQSGSGGEYTPQLGFGWTNGVMLTMMRELADDYDSVCKPFI
eukprot:m.145870 g.145870  ORF g.145870 m.145870 type:complete len:662 (-) comp16225_c0_seq2:1120-3105(-)